MDSKEPIKAARYQVGNYYVVNLLRLHGLYIVTKCNDHKIEYKIIGLDSSVAVDEWQYFSLNYFITTSEFDKSSRPVTKEEATEWIMKYQ